MSELTQQLVQSLFDYRDGKLFWKNSHAKGKIKEGQEAGCLSSRGYHRVMIGYKEYPTHRIIFLLHHGYAPKVIDHINNNSLDNRIENLREASCQTNMYNKRIGVNNKSGCKNVSWNSKSKTWQIHIKSNKKVRSWYVKDFELAELIAIEARSLYHGEFACHV